MNLCGTPDEEFMKKITSEEARSYIRTLPIMKKKSFKETFKGSNPDGISILDFYWIHKNWLLFTTQTAIDLLEKMLELDADKRFSLFLLKTQFLTLFAFKTDSWGGISPPLLSTVFRSFWRTHRWFDLILILFKTILNKKNSFSDRYDESFEERDLSVNEWKSKLWLQFVFHCFPSQLRTRLVLKLFSNWMSKSLICFVVLFVLSNCLNA